MRIDIAAWIAATASGGTRPFDNKAAFAAIRSYFGRESPYTPEEDPTEACFTECIPLFGDNYLTFPGMLFSEAPQLRRLLDVLIVGDPQFGAAAKQLVETARAALHLSHITACRLGRDRYEPTAAEPWSEISILQAEGWNVASAATRFTQDDLFKTFKKPLDTITALEPLISERSDISLFKYADRRKNPLFSKPFILTNGTLIVASPTSIVSSLRHHILSRAAKDRFMPALASGHREVALGDTLGYLWQLKFRPTGHEFAARDGVDRRAFWIDDDKIAIVASIWDTGDNYDIDDPFGEWTPSIDLDLLSKTFEADVKAVATKQGISPDNVQILLVPASLGRSMFLKFDVPKSNGGKIIVLTPEDLEAVAGTWDTNSLTLWRFDAARRAAQERGIDVKHLGFLDAFAFYKQRHESFYASDEAVNLLHIAPGTGTQLVVEARRRVDLHGRWLPQRKEALRLWRPRGLLETWPVYVPALSVPRSLHHCVEIENTIIWFDSATPLDDLHEDGAPLVGSTIDMLSHWTASIADLIESWNINEILLIEVDMERPEAWTKPEEYDDISAATGTVETESPTHWILKIPLGFRKAIDDAKTDEKDPHEHLFRTVFSAIAKARLGRDLTPEEIKRITQAARDNDARFTTGASGPQQLRLTHKGVGSHVTVPEHEIERALDGLVTTIGENVPQERVEVPEAKRKELLAKCRDHFLKELRRRVELCATDKLLEALLRRHETLLQSQAYDRLYYAKRAQLGEVDAKAVAKREQEYTRGVMSCRTAIEATVAIQGNGTLTPSATDLDELLASAHHAVNYGLWDEGAHWKIYDAKLSLLPTGRVGQDRTSVEPMEAFVTSRAENLLRDDETDMIGDSQDAKKFQNERKRIDEAVREEYGFSLKEVGDVSGALLQLAWQADDGVARLNIQELEEALKTALNWDMAQIRPILDWLSLRKQAAWADATAPDSMPWRYARINSYIRRPVLVTGPPDKEYARFSFRHVSDTFEQFATAIVAGSYKPVKDHGSLKKILVEISQERSKRFAKGVANLYRKIGFQVEENVKIGPGKRLQNPEDLGDVDVLAVDPKTKTLYSLELKESYPGRSPREIALELKEMFGSEDNDPKSWFGKHARRHEWLTTNLAAVVSALKPGEVNEVVSGLVFARDLPGVFLRQSPLPTLTLRDIRDDPVEALQTLRKGSLPSD